MKEFFKDEIFLLSKEEYTAWKRNIPAIHESWWLRSPFPSLLSDSILAVDGKTGSTYSQHVWANAYLRPALWIGGGKKIGERFIKYGVRWITVSHDIAISEYPLTNFSFDNESNDYGTSKVRNFLLDWLTANRKSKKQQCVRDCKYSSDTVNSFGYYVSTYCHKKQFNVIFANSKGQIVTDLSAVCKTCRSYKIHDRKECHFRPVTKIRGLRGENLMTMTIEDIEKIMDEDAQEFILRPGCKNENKGFFFNGRFPKGEVVPEGWFKYDFRGSDYDSGRLVYLEKKVGVNHAGTFLTQTEVKFPKTHPDWISLKGKGGYTFA